MIKAADVVCGLAWGDEAKGKIAAWLAKNRKYDYVCRWAGGSNAGHTVYVNKKKYKTHVVPAGVFFGVPSVIGPGCVVHKGKLYDELQYLYDHGFDTSLVKVSPRAHIVTDEHIEIDNAKLAGPLGTTGSGIAPCYSDKAARVGTQAKDVLSPRILWDEKLSGEILCEGAQGIWLDLDHGNYPYVTSSTTLPYGACSLGFPAQAIRHVFGAAKIYDTRSGVDPLFPDDLLDNPALLKVGDVGEEYGVTTGRRRKVNWLDLTRLISAVNVTGTTHLVISKCDVLKDVGVYRLFEHGKVREFKSLNQMNAYVRTTVMDSCPRVLDIKFSFDPTVI